MRAIETAEGFALMLRCAVAAARKAETGEAELRAQGNGRSSVDDYAAALIDNERAIDELRDAGEAMASFLRTEKP